MAKKEFSQIDWLNNIRYEASQEYQKRIPEATQANLQDIYATILNEGDIYAEFADILIKVARTILHVGSVRGHLEFMNDGQLDMGCAVEEIMTDIFNSYEYDPNDCNLCPKDQANIKAFYQTQNRANKYQVSINPERMRCAFSSRDGLGALINSILKKLRDSNDYDEFVIKKQLLGAVEVTEVNVADVTDVASAKSLVQAINTYIDKLTFPSRDFNKAGFMVETDKADIRVIMRSDIMRQLDALLYTDAYNVNFAKIDAPVELVDDFGENTDMICMIQNEKFIRVMDRLRTERSFENGSNLNIAYWYHVWQVFMASNFLEAVRIRKEVPTTSATVDSEELTLAVGATHQAVVTTQPTNASYTNVVWASSDENVATVSEDGLITAIAAGSANITGTLPNTDLTVTVAVTVE